MICDFDKFFFSISFADEGVWKDKNCTNYQNNLNSLAFVSFLIENIET